MRFRNLALAGLLGAAGLGGALELAAQERPEGFEQILPRGRIAAVNEPVYVSADDAKIRDDSWVLGVVIEGEAFAYSLNLLNSHEVVNDSVGRTNFAAVW